MTIIKSFFIAFSMYSKIPVPQFPWEEKEMQYPLCFFPWIGAVIGGLLYLWGVFCSQFQIGTLCFTMIGTAIPLIVSGGFHVDGFLDTMDAFHSYQKREKKLEILKDAHIGAFSVIMTILYYLIYLGALSEVKSQTGMAIVATGFFLSRCLSGIGVVTFTSAKKEGLLFTFASGAQKKIVKGSLYLQLILGMCFLLFLSIQAGLLAIAAALGTFFYYRYRSYKELGGITGDTAGYFVTICEAAFVIAAAVSEHVF